MRALPDDIDIFITADGSPTLVFTRSDGYVEKMHHTGGALAESLYIYREALREGEGCRVLSVGLGLGYNELITLAEFARRGLGEFKIYSFEALPVLREGFTDWAAGRLDSRLANVVDDVARRVAAESGVANLKELTVDALADGRLELRGAFPAELTGVTQIDTVYYDAYSNKMDPELWIETLLTESLGPCLAPRCRLATYAATGALKRALKRLGFGLRDKAGFQGKRQSTLAVRNELS